MCHTFSRKAEGVALEKASKTAGSALTTSLIVFNLFCRTLLSLSKFRLLLGASWILERVSRGSVLVRTGDLPGMLYISMYKRTQYVDYGLVSESNHLVL